MRHAAVDGFRAMVHDDFCVVDHALRFQVAADFADDGAHAYGRYMAGELPFPEQRILRVQRAYDLASVPAPDALALTGWVQSYESYVRSAWKPFSDVHEHLETLSRL
ncbi:hypothetical protein ACF046_01540 [Glutamicibacter creatinolyticus]|uniref:hypothetical protein n=2 Tax=Glutamicibacter creatinolyticus TaxID=162496 RepID=UPI0034099DB9